jgi:hypothetical protein
VIFSLGVVEAVESVFFGVLASAAGNQNVPALVDG